MHTQATPWAESWWAKTGPGGRGRRACVPTWDPFPRPSRPGPPTCLLSPLPLLPLLASSSFGGHAKALRISLCSSGPALITRDVAPEPTKTTALHTLSPSGCTRVRSRHEVAQMGRGVGDRMAGSPEVQTIQVSRLVPPEASLRGVQAAVPSRWPTWPSLCACLCPDLSF